METLTATKLRILLMSIRTEHRFGLKCVAHTKIFKCQDAFYWEKLT